MAEVSPMAIRSTNIKFIHKQWYDIIQREKGLSISSHKSQAKNNRVYDAVK